MELASPAFGANQPIADAHTSKGAGTSPPLAISDIPAGAQSLTLIMHDLDAPSGDFVHWVVWNMSESASLIPEGRVPTGSLQGTNDFGRPGYGAPAPPSGTHRYVFDLYALNSELTVAPGSTAKIVLAAMEGHILTTAQLIGNVDA